MVPLSLIHLSSASKTIAYIALGSVLELGLGREMAHGKWNVIGRWLSRFEPSGPPHSNQVANETVHGARLAMERLNCESCVEENKVCECGHGNELQGDGDNSVVANSTFTQSVINMAGMLIGLGQLSTPYALENGGWASAFLLVGLGIICAYTSHLMGKCLKDNTKLKNYQDIGEHAFGMKGRVIAATFVYWEIFMALVSYTISLSDNLGTVFLGTHLKIWVHMTATQLLTVMAVLVALPSLWLRDLSSISLLSFGGILMSIVIFATIGWTAAFSGIKSNHRIPVLNLHKIPGISGLYVFSYGGHIVFPNIYKAMKDPSKFTKVSIVSFAIVTSIYTSLAFMGAKLFGPEVQSQITLSMPRHLIVTKIALWATVLKLMTKYALEFAPVAMQLESKFPSSMSSNTRMLLRGSFGSILLLGILCLALLVPYFEHVLSLTGSLVTITICITLPCAFYLKTCWSQVSKLSVILNSTLIAIGFFLGVLGTMSSFKGLVRNVQSGRST
ncbi:hypothetical protein AAC387_Pa12g1262 [Persea americana]